MPWKYLKEYKSTKLFAMNIILDVLSDPTLEGTNRILFYSQFLNSSFSHLEIEEENQNFKEENQNLKIVNHKLEY